MKKLFTILALSLLSQLLMAQSKQAPTISNMQLVPALDVTRFSAYELSAEVTPNDYTIDSVDAVITPLLSGDDYPNNPPATRTNYFVDGSEFEEDEISRSLSNTSGDNIWETTGSQLIYPDQIYPEIFFMSSDITHNNAPSNKRVSASNYDLMHFQNPLTITPTTSFFIEFYATPVTTNPPSVDLQVYLVGTGETISFFNDPNWTNDANAELVGTFTEDAVFNHEHSDNSKHHLVALFADGDSTIGNKNLDVTGDFWIVLTTSHKLEKRGWDLKYHPEENNYNRWYSGSGSNYSVQTLGAPDVHVHIAKNAGDNTGDGVHAKYTVTYDTDQTTSNNSTFYFGDIPNLAPNKGSFTAPDPEYTVVILQSVGNPLQTQTMMI